MASFSFSSNTLFYVHADMSHIPNLSHVPNLSHWPLLFCFVFTHHTMIRFNIIHSWGLNRSVRKMLIWYLTILALFDLYQNIHPLFKNLQMCVHCVFCVCAFCSSSSGLLKACWDACHSESGDRKSPKCTEERTHHPPLFLHLFPSLSFSLLYLLYHPCLCSPVLWNVTLRREG